MFRALLVRHQGVFEVANLFYLLGINKFHIFHSVRYTSITTI